MYIQKSFCHNQVYGIGEFWTKFQDLTGLVALALRLFNFAFIILDFLGLGHDLEPSLFKAAARTIVGAFLDFT